VVDDPRRRSWEERWARGKPPSPPSAFVADVLDALARADSGGTTAPRRALDVACGAGRHALAAAAHGYQVTAVDYARPALAALRADAAERGLAIGAIHPLAADVETWPIPRARFDLVMVVDFLWRPLFPALRAAVAPGGVLIVETFLAGQDQNEKHGHPSNPDFLLRPGELAALCRGWEVLAAHEGETADPAPARRAGIATRAPGAALTASTLSGLSER
jgi:SAM-dependent methyltransferase